MHKWKHFALWLSIGLIISIVIGYQLFVDLEKNTLSGMHILAALGRAIGNVWNYKVVVVDKEPITISNIALGLILFTLALRAAKHARLLLRTKLLSRLQLEPSIQDTLEKLSYYAMLLVMTLIALDMANVPLRIFTFVGGAFAIGIGFASQNIIKNFISGLILMIERPIRRGDLIEVNNVRGTVLSIGARCTHLHTSTNIDMLVPNSSLLESNLINWTFGDSRVRVHIPINVANEANTKQVEEALLAALEPISYVIKTPVPQVFFTAFGDGLLQFEVHFWLDLSMEVERKKVTSDILHNINEIFHTYSIPLPKRDTYVNATTPLELKIVSSTGAPSTL